MSKKKRTIIVVGRLKEFDEEAWKRLLMAYAYYLHEQRNEVPVPQPPENESNAGGRS